MTDAAVTPTPSYLSSFAAGTAGGIAGLCIGHPFDTVKVRLQTPDRMSAYSGTLNCFKTIIKQERFKGLYKGMASPMAGVAIINAFVFGVYGFFMNVQLSSPNDTPTLMQIGLAGMGSGVVNSFITCPMELAKIRIQNQTALTNTPFTGPASFLLFTLRREGIRGCYRGMTSTVLREMSFGPYFISYELFCRCFARRGGGEDLGAGPLILAGGLAGMTAWLSTYPMDSLKTRIQAQEGIDGKYLGLRQVSRLAWKQGGWRGYWRGLNATLLRAFPTNAVTFLVYEAVMKYLENRNQDNIEKKQHRYHGSEHGRRLPEGMDIYER